MLYHVYWRTCLFPRFNSTFYTNKFVCSFVNFPNVCQGKTMFVSPPKKTKATFIFILYIRGLSSLLLSLLLHVTLSARHRNCSRSDTINCLQQKNPSTIVLFVCNHACQYIHKYIASVLSVMTYYCHQKCKYNIWCHLFEHFTLAIYIYTYLSMCTCVEFCQWATVTMLYDKLCACAVQLLRCLTLDTPLALLF